jgi:hypothetical protein
VVTLMQWSLTDLPSFRPVTYCARPFRRTILIHTCMIVLAYIFQLNSWRHIFIQKPHNKTHFAWSAAIRSIAIRSIAFQNFS